MNTSLTSLAIDFKTDATGVPQKIISDFIDQKFKGKKVKKLNSNFETYSELIPRFNSLPIHYRSFRHDSILFGLLIGEWYNASIRDFEKDDDFITINPDFPFSPLIKVHAYAFLTQNELNIDEETYIPINQMLIVRSNLIEFNTYLNGTFENAEVMDWDYFMDWYRTSSIPPSISLMYLIKDLLHHGVDLDLLELL